MARYAYLNVIVVEVTLLQPISLTPLRLTRFWDRFSVHAYRAIHADLSGRSFSGTPAAEETGGDGICGHPSQREYEFLKADKGNLQRGRMHIPKRISCPYTVFVHRSTTLRVIDYATCVAMRRYKSSLDTTQGVCNGSRDDAAE
jgi:hypothetical protein